MNTGAASANSDRLRFEYFHYGTAYYATGRFAYYSGSIPVAGNLLHHAIEMFLKGCICGRTTEKERRDLGHKLDKLWSKFREASPASDLDQHQATIADLNEFEDLRYPEEILKGAAIYIGAGSSGSGGPERVFRIETTAVDALVVALHREGSVNPKAMAMKLNSNGMDFLTRHNEHAAKWST